MKTRSEFLKRSNTEAFSKKYEQEAADGLDYLGNEREIEEALNELEARLQLRKSSSNSWKIWSGVAAVLLAGFFAFLFIPPLNTKNFEDSALLSKKAEKTEIFSSGITDTLLADATQKPGIQIVKNYLPVVKQDYDHFEPESLKDKDEMATFSTTPEVSRNASPVTATQTDEVSVEPIPKMAQKEMITAQDQSNDKLRESSSWEKSLYESGIWDGKSKLNQINIPVSVKNGKILIKRSKRFSDAQWNALDSLIAPFSENDIRKGCLLLTLPLR